jgi:hypothetical protein
MRIDSITGKLIKSGYCFQDGEFYCADETEALKYAQEQGYKDLEESFEAENHYWTEWEVDEDDFEYADDMGGETEIWKHKESDNYLRVPIEIKRDFDNAWTI